MKAKPTMIRMPKRGAQSGFSMVEVLVSLLLMTIGLLGVSGLMVAGVNNTTGFDLGSRASQAANEIMDAMRANSINHAAYVTTYGTTPSSLSGTTPQDTDRKRWLEEVQKLPGGDGKIETVTGFPGQYLISIRFANCMGTLSTTEKNNCISSTSDNEKRTISFTFKI